jgi:hypothetical protein
MRASSMKRWIGVAILGTIGSLMAACGSSGTGSGTTGASGCTPGAQQACACPGGTQGAQVCSDDGRSFKACDCGSGSSSTSGTGGAGGSLISTGTGMPSCGDGIVQPGECNPGEFYCAADCGGTGGNGGGTTTTTTTSGTGGACAGVVVYAGKVDLVGSVWASGHGLAPNKNTMDTDGKTGVAAGDAMCNHVAAGSHACDFSELQIAKDDPGFKALAVGTTAWIQRSAATMVGGQNYPAGKGARCDDWTYATDHLNDGEWVEFKAQGTPTYHLDLDPNTIQANPKDSPCGHNDLDRAILCCNPCQ